MKKKLYYVVHLELQDVGDSHLTTGNKTIIVYDIIDNIPSNFCELDIDITYNSKEAIQDYLNDNGHGDETFEFIQL